MNHSHIPSFPNSIPHIDWKTYLPIFKDTKYDDAILHLVQFHKHVRKLTVYH